MRLLLLIAAFLSAAPAFAADAPAPVHAIAMHGEPKYKADYKNFDYVNPAAPKGGTLKLSSIGTFDSLNPFIVKGTPAAGLSYLGQSSLYDSLMEQSYDEPFTMYCLLCSSVEMPEDRTWIAFNLRPEAKWADGQPITADDIIWTFHTLLDKGAPFFKAYYGDVKDVIAESPSRVKFVLGNGQNTELPLIVSQMPVLPKHYWAAPGHVFENTTLDAPLGSGPYKVGQINAGRSIEYVRRADYWGKDLPINKGRFNFDRITYDYYRDGDVALEAFFAGEYDVREENTAKLWATAYDAPPVVDGRITKAEIPNQRPQGMQAFLYNLRRPIFQDIRVREALGYALDFEWSNKQIAFGSYKRSRSFFSNSPLGATGLPQGRELEILQKYKGKIPDEVFTSEFNTPTTDGSGNNRDNLKKAADILEAAGYKLGKDGVRTKGNIRLEFEIIDSNPAFERWIIPMVQNMKRIGVVAHFRQIDAAQYQNRMNEFDFDMTSLGIGQSDSPGNEQRDFWSSSKADVKGSRNYIGIKNPVVDELVEDLIKARTAEDLEAYCHALDRVLQWNYYVIPEWHLDHWRLAWWGKLQKPEHLSGLTPAISDTWWAKGAKQ